MIYTFFSVIICVFFAFLSVGWEKKKDYRKTLFFVNTGTAAAGAIMMLTVFLVSRQVISSAENELSEWAWDMMYVFYGVTFPICAVLLLFIIITAMLAWGDSGSRIGFRCVIRSIASVFSSALILLLGGFYSVSVKNTSLPMTEFVCLFSFGEAMLFRILYAIEYRSHLLSNVKNK